MVEPEEPRANNITNQQVQPAEEDLDRPQRNLNDPLDTVEHRLNNIDVEPREGVSNAGHGILNPRDSGLRKPVDKSADYSANPSPDGLHIIDPQPGEEPTDRSKRGPQRRHSGVGEPGHDI